MTDVHKRSLRQNMNYLVENIIPDTLVNILQSKGVLQTQEVARIMKKDTMEEQSDCLIGYLMKKQDAAYAQFVSALQESGQPHLANRLEPSG